VWEPTAALRRLLRITPRNTRRSSPEVLARLWRGPDVDLSEYTLRASTEIDTAAPDLDLLKNRVFIGVAGRQADAMIYETYLPSESSRAASRGHHRAERDIGAVR
jgi:Protein of unknown function (DUF3237)